MGLEAGQGVLERLWNHGDLVIAGRQGFQRLYDLAERVMPSARSTRRSRPSASGCARSPSGRPRARRADRRGRRRALAAQGRRRAGPAGVDALVADGRLERLQVDDGGADVLVAADADLDRAAPAAAVLLSPFDNLLWDRPFARRSSTSTI